MSGDVKWMGAKRDGDLGKSVAAVLIVANNGGAEGTWPKLDSHTFGATTGAGMDIEIAAQHDWQSDPDIWLYRKKTTALLRRYMRWSLEAGRLPSLLGRELFRAKISAFTATTFEARVIFLHDVEKCLDRLKSFDRQVVARVLLQEYDHESAARILQCTRRTLERRLPELIDELSESLLRSDLLERLPETTENRDE
ncbi:MAG: hypothetical protein WA474_22245 [Candidatus Sulfotelmatobacter sp.]